MTSLILASSSKPRQSLLIRLQIPFQIFAPDIDETPNANESPENLVQRLSLQKAQAVADKFPDSLIIAADQVGVLGKQILGKPLTQEKAFQQLKNASGKRMEFYIGMTVLNATKEITVLEKFNVKYRTLSDEDIAAYLAKEEPLQCAGSCKVEGLGIALIDSFEGADFTALIGLPLIRLVNMLKQFDLDVLTFNDGASH